MPCTAQKAMNQIDLEGFSTYGAERWCEFHGGEVVFGDLANPPKQALWRTYKFPDQSMMNVHDRGCTVFYTEGEFRRWESLPSEKANSLY